MTTQTIKSYSLDTKAIVAFFGGPAAIETGRRNIGLPGWGQKSISKCMARGSIPTERLLELKSLASSQGKNFKIDDYIKELTQ